MHAQTSPPWSGLVCSCDRKLCRLEVERILIVLANHVLVLVRRGTDDSALCFNGVSLSISAEFISYVTVLLLITNWLKH